jgi:flagellar basal-body rod modification protein FlgD
MSVSGVSATNSGQSALAGQATSIAGNFETFLSLLTTQLQNQDPLDPLDTNQFTQQLVEFSGVEQQLNTNSYLQTLVQATQNSQNNAAVSYIGKQITSSGKDSDLVNGQATWSFNAPEAANVTVTITNAKGNQVYTESGQIAAGPGQFNWDGTGSDGSPQPAGTYAIAMTATDSNGKSVAIDTETTGVVTGVDLSGSEPNLIVGSKTIKMSDITSVAQPSPGSAGS